MTFKLFNIINALFIRGKQVVLRRYSDVYGDYCNINYYDENSDIMDINNDLEKYPDAKLFEFNGDFYKEIEY